MDWWEEITTRQADIILANSRFTARIFKSYFPSISQTPRVVYPGINISAYEDAVDLLDLDTVAVTSQRPTLLSLNRFEGKKNALLALEAFGLLKSRHPHLGRLRLVLAGGYDPRLEDNVRTLQQLVDRTSTLSLTYNVTSPGPIPYGMSSSDSETDVLFVLNFTTSQRTALLLSSSSLALLYTPANEHFGIVPVEAMACGIPVLACDSGGPTESVVDASLVKEEGTGWLQRPDPQVWADTLLEIVNQSPSEREEMAQRAKARARSLFGMEAMTRGLDDALQQAVDLGPVDVFGWTMIVIAFFLAYLAGPFLLP
ncbi:Alpha-1,3/1,6-mannosyltransferase ALG2 [Psilocybe cubensis]|nr:Alpha-1,3/1,6-mannosyltransferase ALG2 [Psilocybe cubensis]KAH9484108.1 Alpha-1,3/1,6-mannosyltransferase ALG2 [Psilocybe cubensis]